MKHLKIYESAGPDMEKVEIFIEKIQDKFFHKSVEFKKIDFELVKTIDIYKFYVRFYKIEEDDLNTIEEFCEYMKFGKKRWLLETKIFENSGFPDIYFEFHLYPETLDKYIEKFKFEENVNRYNL